jgi:hypothetical protein
MFWVLNLVTLSLVEPAIAGLAAPAVAARVGNGISFRKNSAE